MNLTYAIGDIHGRDHLLEKIYTRIETDPYRDNASAKPTVVHIGDYIDGGPNSDKVLDLVMRGSPKFKSISLLGNHEALMLECLETDDRDVWWNWLSNGGNKTLDAFGISNRFGRYNPVRRHIICPRFRPGLRETLLIVLIDIKRRLCGIASVDVR